MAKDELNPKQKLFCKFYASGEGMSFGDEVWSYILAYKIDVPLIDYSKLNKEQKNKYDDACSMASRLLSRNIKIQKRCNELLDLLIKDEVADRELAWTMTQRKELGPKVSAIKEYNNVKKRTDPNKFTGEIKIVWEK